MVTIIILAFNIMKEIKTIYFPGSSYTCIFQLGAASYIRKHYDINKINFYGCSAGALVALMIFLFDTDELIQMYKDIVGTIEKTIDTDPFSIKSYNITKCHFKVFEKINKLFPEAYKIVTGKINVGVTTPLGFKWYSKFKSNAHMFNILLSSFHIPFLCSYNATLKGYPSVDGGVGIDYAKDVPKDALVICSIGDESCAHISGSMSRVNIFKPLTPEEIDKYYKKGYKKTKNYLNDDTVDDRVLGFCFQSYIKPLFFILRLLQPEDTEYTFDKLKFTEK